MPNTPAELTGRAARTQTSLIEAIYTALTVPALQYRMYDQTSAPITLPIANVFPKGIWQVGSDPPSPLVSFQVSGAGQAFSRGLPDRKLTAKFWIVSSADEDECSELYEAVRARIHTADQDATGPASDLSRAAAATTLPLTVRECIEQNQLPPTYDAQTSRWYLTAEYRVIAI